MAVGNQLVQLFQAIGVEAFQEIDTLGHSREGVSVTGQNEVDVQIANLI